MKLMAKVMLVLLATVTLFTVVASYLSVRAIYNDFETQQQVLARHLASELHGRLELAYRQQGVAGVLRLLETLLPPRGGSWQTRWVWFDTLAPPALQPRTDVRYWINLRAGEIVSVMSPDASGRSQLHTYLSLPLVNAPWAGGLEITESLTLVEKHARRTAWLAISTVVGLAVVSMATAYWAGLHWVARPLDALIEKTRQIGAGNFASPLPIVGDDELTQLGKALNEMCTQLAQQQATIVAETAQRVAALDQLRHSDRLKTVGRLAAGLAHELGTPLHVVAGRAALITSGKLSHQEIVASAHTIKSEADRITRIVRQLLDFARQRPPLRKQTDLGQLLQRTIHLLQPLADKQNVRLSVRSPLPHLHALIDEAQMQQVLTNMIVNAVQAMPEGGEVELDVYHTAAPPTTSLPHPPPADRPVVDGPVVDGHDQVCLTVTDNGPGISPDVREHLFEPFFTTKDVGEGTGLGLSIAYGIVQEHGGAIEVVNLPERGAQFQIYLPQGETGGVEP